MNEPILENEGFNFVLWLVILALLVSLIGLILRRRAPLNAAARLNAVFGPLIFGCAWLYGVVFEPANNFATILEDGFLGYWFRPRETSEMQGHYGQLAVLAAFGLVLLAAFALRIWRRASQARGSAIPAIALVFWCLGALVVYYVPWCLADMLTNYSSFQNGVDDVGEFLSSAAQHGVFLAAALGFGAMAIAWWLTGMSMRPASLPLPNAG